MIGTLIPAHLSLVLVFFLRAVASSYEDSSNFHISDELPLRGPRANARAIVGPKSPAKINVVGQDIARGPS